MCHATFPHIKAGHALLLVEVSRRPKLPVRKKHRKRLRKFRQNIQRVYQAILTTTLICELRETMLGQLRRSDGRTLGILTCLGHRHASQHPWFMWSLPFKENSLCYPDEPKLRRLLTKFVGAS